MYIICTLHVYRKYIGCEKLSKTLIRDEEREKILQSISFFNFKNQDAEQSRKGNVAMDMSQMIHGHMMNMPAEGIDKMMSALKGQ